MSVTGSPVVSGVPVVVPPVTVPPVVLPAPVHNLSGGTSDTSIANLALGRLGISFFIIDLETEQSVEAKVIRRFYDATRDRVLAAANWGFTTTFVELQDVGSPPLGWAYRYRYPGDCLAARKILAPDYVVTAADYLAYYQISPRDTLIPFRVAGDTASAGRVILCNQEQATLEYSARITDPALFPATFIAALAWALAADIAGPLAASPDMAKAALQGYRQTLNEACGLDFMERSDNPAPTPDLIAARY